MTMEDLGTGLQRLLRDPQHQRQEPGDGQSSGTNQNRTRAYKQPHRYH